MSHSMQQPQYGQHAPVPQPARNGLGTAALVLGIIGALSGLIPLLFWLAGILGLLALILGLSGRGRVKRGEAVNKGVATTGAVLGLVSLILSVVGVVITFKAVDDAVDEVKSSTSSTETQTPGGDGKNKSKSKDKGDKKGKGASAPKADDTDKGKGLAAGDAAVYDDDLKISVSAPKAYTPGEYSAGHTKGNKAYTVTVVVENAGKEKFEAAGLTADATAGQDGVAAEQIFDGEIGGGFTSAVLPGKKATVQFAFDAPADAKTLTVEISPNFEYNASQWELKL
ncbi:DUF4352 domain-containing protein [Streptomyces sp. NPDC051907]|uniref:DUF4352 domain-containing protein n=1 Tax=Streptomyces sp. NPDC051907 TaxID=3155284 RepID=UPI00342877DC